MSDMVRSMKPTRRLHNGREQWCYDWIDDQGNRHRNYDDDKNRAYQKFMAMVTKVEQKAGKPGNAEPRKVGTRGNPTVTQAVEKWLTESEKLGASSRTKYRNNYKNHLKSLIGELPVKKLTTGQCQAAFASLKAQRIGDSAYFHCWTELHACLEWLRFSGVISKNPMDKMQKPTRNNKVSQKDDTYISQMESTVIGILNWISNKDNQYHKYYPLIMALNLGLRRAEVLGITTEKISRPDMTLTVSNQLELQAGGAYIKPSTKGSKGELRSRVIPLPSQHYAALCEEIDKHKNDEDAGLIAVKLDGKVIDYQHLVFIREDGKNYSYNDLRNIWIEIQQAYKKEVKLDDKPLTEKERIRLHGNRHVACSLLAYQGNSLQTIQAILGHLTPAMTNHYTHYATDQLREATTNYADAIFQKDNQEMLNEMIKMNHLNDEPVTQEGREPKTPAQRTETI